MSSALEEGTSRNQYLVVENIDQAAFERLDKDGARARLGVPTRFTYWYDYKLLIIKVPTQPHESAHREMGRNIEMKMIRMNMDNYNLSSIGSTTFRSANRKVDTSKEGDSAYLPLDRDRDDWPSLVIEAGYSESLSALQADAKWWLANSDQKVQIVIIININAKDNEFIIEKWCNVPGASASGAATRGRLANPLVPDHVQELLIIQNPTPQTGYTQQAQRTHKAITTVQPGPRKPGVVSAYYDVVGAPLLLEFDKIFLRAPVPPEQDFTFSALELAEWAHNVWRCS